MNIGTPSEGGLIAQAKQQSVDRDDVRHQCKSITTERKVAMLVCKLQSHNEAKGSDEP
jgi:hypothetical protein